MFPFCPNKFTFNFCANGHRICAPCMRQYILHYYQSTTKFVLRCPMCNDLNPQECLWAIAQAWNVIKMNDAKLEPVLCSCTPPCRATVERIGDFVEDVCEPEKVGLCAEAGHFLMEIMAVRKRFCENMCEKK